MSDDIEKMLGRIYTTFESKTLTKKSRLENNRILLTSLYEGVIHPAMQRHLSSAKKKGFKVEAHKTIRGKKAKFAYKMFINPNGTFIEVKFDATISTPKITMSAQSSCRGTGKQFKGSQYAYNEINKQVIDEYMKQTLSQIILM